MSPSPITRYTPTHEWVRIEGDVATVGITDFAQAQLGDVVFVELPVPGTRVARGAAFGVVESVKAAVDLVAPLTGEVLTRNDVLADAPEAVNTAPLTGGWMITVRIADAAELADLLDEAAYEALVREE